MADRVLSIVIAVRNQARPLRRLLARLRTLRTPPGWQVEVICVYTPSGDDTLSVLEQSGFKIVHNSAIGLSVARNTGVAAARGELLYFTDADACPVGDDFLLRLVAAADRFEGFGAFGGPILLHPRQRWNPVALGDHLACWFNWHPTRRTKETTLFQPTVSLVMRRAVFEAVGGFDPGLRVLEDFEIESRVLQRRLPIYFVQDLAVTHEARGSLWRSWRHSWYWGAPFRSAFLEKTPDYGLPHPVDSGRFWRNLPYLYRRRLRRVFRNAWGLSRGDTLIAAPFIAATVFAWALAAVLGKGQPPPTKAAPV
jgi:GT2 family glycosyltransferase